MLLGRKCSYTYGLFILQNRANIALMTIRNVISLRDLLAELDKLMYHLIPFREHLNYEMVGHIITFRCAFKQL